jgi:hypothetical protein
MDAIVGKEGRIITTEHALEMTLTNSTRPTMTPTQSTITNQRKPKNEERNGESTRQPVESDENSGTTKSHKPRRSNTPVESPGENLDSTATTERIEMPYEELADSTKAKRGKRTAKNKTKLQSSDAAQDHNTEEDNSNQGGREQNSSPNESSKISKKSPSFYTINAAHSTSNSNLLSPTKSSLFSTDNSPLKSALPQSTDKLPLPTIGNALKMTSFPLEDEPQVCEKKREQKSRGEGEKGGERERKGERARKGEEEREWCSTKRQVR